MESPTDPAPRERPDLQPDPTDIGQSVPLVYWIGPRHASVDVLELSDGLSLFTSICHQQGLITGECVSLKGRLSQSSYYATAWNAVLATSPVLLYIEPPRIEEIPDYERRSVALFCLEAARYQLRHKRHFVLVHPVDSTFRRIPQATSLFSDASVSWGPYGSMSGYECY